MVVKEELSLCADPQIDELLGRGKQKQELVAGVGGEAGSPLVCRVTRTSSPGHRLHSQPRDLLSGFSPTPSWLKGAGGTGEKASHLEFWAGNYLPSHLHSFLF